MKKASKKRRQVAVFAIILLAFFLYAFSIEPYWLTVKTYSFSQDVPIEFKGKKIIFISDFHGGYFFNQDKIKTIIDKANALNPDIVVLGGDYIDSDPKYIKPVFDQLKSLKAPLGIYAVLGNHDSGRVRKDTRKSQILQEMQKSGIISLVNKSQWISLGSDKIKIGGVGDVFTDFQQINPTVHDVSEKDLTILVSHSPDFAEDLKDKKIDLVLSGHNHGGQVTLFDLWAPVVPSKFGNKYLSGVIKTDNTQVIVSNGVGTSMLPLRFFARPDISIINLN